MKAAALIVAAGRGSRARVANGTGPDPTGTDALGAPAKQYEDLDGRSMLERALRPFVECADIADIQVVIHRDDRAAYDRSTDWAGSRLRNPVIGGTTRQASVFAGLRALDGLSGNARPDAVLIHDAARPFVSVALISRVIAELDRSAAVVPALPVVDTLKATDQQTRITRTIPRDGLYRAQTPQGFHFASILEAHLAAVHAQRSGTDDSSLIEALGQTVAVIPGEPSNIKITTADDLSSARRRFSEAAALTLQDIRVGSGYDVHAFAPGNQVMLCGIAIPFERGLLGHSDADVGLHALTDAILGALGDGDIGAHFPPSDSRWAGASSDIFLREAGGRVVARGGILAHADVTLICERPKIRPHVDPMRNRIAEILSVPASRISVKATTTERLGFTGREEGIAAMATATIRLPLSAQ